MRVVVSEIDDDARNASEEEREEHETGFAGVEVVAEGEDDGVGFEEEVDATVDELQYEI